MPIIRMTRKQIQAANKAREAALKKDGDFRLHEEQRQSFELNGGPSKSPVARAQGAVITYTGNLVSLFPIE